MNTKRLLKLADAVEAFGERFDFQSWTTGWGGLPNVCGTTACALGLAVEMWGAECGVFFRSVEHECNPSICYRNGGGSVVSARAIFGEDLTRADYDILFTPCDTDVGGFSLMAHASAKQWAEHARHFVTEYERTHLEAESSQCGD
jgi:hypothetical protein